MSKFINWDNTIDLNVLLEKYRTIEKQQDDAPVTLDLAPPPEKPHIIGDPPQRFFDPPLQCQRNMFMYDELKHISRATAVTKIAILGCGELSFEKYSLTKISDVGVERIVSIDVDETSLSHGMQYLSNTLYHSEETTQKRNGLPVHIEVYKGDILTTSPILSNVDVACSTEVIEHMPLEQASLLLQCVLSKIRPKAYIISTPNAEYNVAFNRETGFRHDDHHFEFTRSEFKNWLEENVHHPYRYEIYFVGNLLDYDHLGGATQFAVIRRDGEESGREVKEDEEEHGDYHKVGDFVYRNGYYRLFESVVVGAFKKFIQNFAFSTDQILKVGTIDFWRLSIESILEYRTQPTIEIEADDAMLLIARLFPSVCYKSVDPMSNSPAIAIPTRYNKEIVIREIEKMFD